MQGKLEEFNSQAKSTRSWITDLMKPLSSPGSQTEDLKRKAQVSETQPDEPVLAFTLQIGNSYFFYFSNVVKKKNTTLHLQANCFTSTFA